MLLYTLTARALYTGDSCVIHAGKGYSIGRRFQYLKLLGSVDP